MIRIVFCCVLSSWSQPVNLVTISLRARFQVYLFQTWVLCTQAKAIQYDFLGVRSFFRFFCFFLNNILGGQSQWMWLVSWRRQGMLTQGPAPDPRYKLNIISFLTLLHSLHCLICTKDIMNMLLQVMGGWEVWVFFYICQGVGGGQGVGVIFFFYFLFCFCAVVNCSFMTGHDSLLCMFYCPFFAFFVFGSFIQALLVQGNWCVFFVKLFQKSSF